ncbi:MAG: O-antigen ligase family protein [Desulfobacula sp.]|nr:O-antigen ligase family protein [Desulfobacula sp.]
MSIKLSKIIFFFLFIFTPLAFGTTEPWAYAIMEILTVTATVLFFFHILKHRAPAYQVPGLFPVTLFLLYILVQLLPMPPSIIQWLSQEAFNIHETTNLITGNNAWMTLSVNQGATLSEFFRYTTYALFYILTVQLLKEKATLQTTALVIVLFGGLLAFSSILQFYMTEDMALWFRHTPKNSIVVGPYANHNHYAGLMEMIFPVVLGIFLFYRPRIGSSSLIKGIAEMMSQEKANIHILIGTSALLILISIFVSLSRGAMISTCLSLVLFTFFLVKRKISKGNTILILSVIMLSALCIGWFGWDQIFERFARLKNAQGAIYESRLDFWKDTANIIGNFTLTGSGMGTFSHVYPIYRTVVSDRFLTHAHNDYLELLAEGGIIGFCLAAIFFITFFYKTYIVFSKRRDAFSIYLYIGCITGIASILFHSVTDFNTHIGANGLWLFFLAGLGVSAANTGLRKHSKDTRLVPINSNMKKTVSFIIVGMVALCAIAFNFSHLVGNFYYSNIRNYIISANTPPIVLEKFKKVAGYAARFNPLQAEYPFSMANSSWFLNDLDQSRNHFKTSIGLDPLNSRHLNRFGTFLARAGENNKADIAFKKSMRYDQSNPDYTFRYAAWLISNNKTDQGVSYMKTVLNLDEKFIDKVLTMMIVKGIDAHKIETVIPKTPGPAIAYSQFLFDTGNKQEAIDRYIETLDLIEAVQPDLKKDLKTHERSIRSYYFLIYRFFKKYNDLKNAMHVMERAERTLPMDAGIKVALGDLYYRQGISYKAAEKYDHALFLQPDNKRALKMLKKINQ